eukprot:CFRG1063T1
MEQLSQDQPEALHCVADICFVPITCKNSASVRNEVAIACKILKDTGLPTHLHGFGTNIEGEFDIIMAAIKRVHLKLHESGVVRISTTVRIGTRTDKKTTIEGKINAIKNLDTDGHVS